MSENDDQKQHQATDRRLTELRDRGQTLRSKDLSSGILLSVAIIAIVFIAGYIGNQFEKNFIISFSNINRVAFDVNQLFDILQSLILSNFFVLMPLMIMLFGVVFLSVFLMGGWNFSMKSIAFNWEKINPIVNLGNIFSKRMFVDVAKSFIKFSIIVSFFLFFISENHRDVLSLPYLTLSSSLSAFYSLIKDFIFTLLIGVFIIVLIDSVYSYMSYHSRIKMTTQELKDEQKDTEGNVDIKRKLRSLQLAMAKQKIHLMVPKANVVIVNPTHYAVALRYREGLDKAPTVVAKGKGDIAKHIRQLALINSVSIYEEPPLARAIYHSTKLGAMINPALYMAVAIVLSYINQLRRYQYGDAPMPIKPTAIDIPINFQYKA